MWRKNKKKMKYRNKQRLKPLGLSISKIYRDNSGNNDTNFLSLMRNWESVIGKEYSGRIDPIQINSKESSLTVSADRSLALESQYISRTLLSKINGFYGFSAFKKINFIFREKKNIKKEKEVILDQSVLDDIEKNICNVKDDALKESLRKLGESMAKKGKIK